MCRLNLKPRIINRHYTKTCKKGLIREVTFQILTKTSDTSPKFSSDIENKIWKNLNTSN